jgi:putative SOS response-associated peptidase YedK
MCGRFVSATDPEGVIRFFTVDDRKADDLPPSWNVAPTDPVHAVVEHAGSRLLVAFRWGLVPSWSTDRKGAARMINARVETVSEKPAYRTALERRRCLIPADGFYEWTKAPDGTRQPHFIAPGDGGLLAFAGLWEVWRDPADPDAELLRTCTILTTAAAEEVRPLHDRMPLTLPADRWDEWLDRDLQDGEAAADLARTAAHTRLRHHAVAPAVNNVRSNGPQLILPLADG